MGRDRVVLGVALALACLGASSASAAGMVRIEVLSNRADVISGGDALVRVVRPDDAAAATVKVTVGGQDQSARFGSDGVGLIDGLVEGRNVVTARIPDGRGAKIVITNHPNGGPVFAGKQLTPWICRPGAKDAQCNRPATVRYEYMDATSGSFSAYDPKAPPAASAIATTTTDQGRKVPYVVRIEEGVQDRGGYAIAVLDGKDVWNHKLLTTFGPATAPHHTQPSPSSVLDDKALSRGFMVANNGLQIHGENTNDVVSTESFMMLKEHIVESYGRIRYTIAQGCSGGSYQVMDEAMYPGLIDGLQPNCTYVDLWTTASDVFDCGLLVHYFSGQGPGGAPLAPWVPAIDGHKEPSNCAAWDATFFNYSDPTLADHCKLDASLAYEPTRNPGGVRCTIADYMSSIFGFRPQSQWTEQEKRIGHGFANLPWGNKGVQYGLVALRSGEITPAQFLDLNQKIGGLTIDGKPQAARSAVDENTASIAYRSGAVTDATKLADVPIIDLRAYSESAEIHTTGHSVKLRARLDRANGNHDNQILWTWDNGAPIVGVGPPVEIELQSFLLIDRWLARMEADKRDIPKARKVVLDKPADAVDACFVGSPGPATTGVPSAPFSQKITDPGQCNTLYPNYSVTRPAAGGPATDDIIQCRLKPVDAEDYLPTKMSDADLATLRTIFPDGVCDWTRPGVGQQPSVPWMTYKDGPGGKGLGDRPVSTPLGGPKACASRRIVKLPTRARKGVRVSRIEIFIGKKRVKSVRGAHPYVSVRLSGRARGTVKVTARVIGTRNGRKVVTRSPHTYRLCAAKGKGSS